CGSTPMRACAPPTTDPFTKEQENGRPNHRQRDSFGEQEAGGRLACLSPCRLRGGPTRGGQRTVRGRVPRRSRRSARRNLRSQPEGGRAQSRGARRLPQGQLRDRATEVVAISDELRVAIEHLHAAIVAEPQAEDKAALGQCLQQML